MKRNWFLCVHNLLDKLSQVTRHYDVRQNASQGDQLLGMTRTSLPSGTNKFIIRVFNFLIQVDI